MPVQVANGVQQRREIGNPTEASPHVFCPVRAQEEQRIFQDSLTVTVLVLVALVVFLLLKRTGAPGPRITLNRTTQVTFDPGLEIDPVLSPDGKLVAYAAGTVGGTNIYVRQLGSSRSIPLTPGVPGYHRWPQWSPDGSRIAFFSVDPRSGVSAISIVPALGGIVKRLIEDPGDSLCCPTSVPFSPYQ